MSYHIIIMSYHINILGAMMIMIMIVIVSNDPPPILFRYCPPRAIMEFSGDRFLEKSLCFEGAAERLWLYAGGLARRCGALLPRIALEDTLFFDVCEVS